MTTGKEVRLQRIWKHRRAVLIPYDHGSYGGPQPGIEDLVRLTARIARTRADGILVSAGVLPQIASAVGQLAIIARLDGGFTKFRTDVHDYQPMWGVSDVLRLGADAGIVFTFVGTPVEGESIRRLGSTAAEAHAWGLPLAAEIIPPSLLNNHFGSSIFPKAAKNSNVHEENMQVARIGAEAGADIIKTRYTGDREGFKRMVHSCGARVIVAGGPTIGGGDDALLNLASECVQAGADGIVFGRNIWQHPRMEKMVAALCAVVHDEETVAQARKLLR
jgi:fructose-bisphosphate aldolase/2-amino-3,7-dideoxy-D-threo-hept-6-ulosonate synthase